MTTGDITNAQITHLIQSKNIENQLSAISQIRQSGNSDLLVLLLELLLESQNIEIEREILRCISDLKDANMLPIIIDSIQNPHFESKKCKLLNALWQTNFDVHSYCDYFIKLIITDTFEIGIEAITLLEISSEHLEDDFKIEQKTMLQQEYISIVDVQKKTLIEQAIAILS